MKDVNKIPMYKRKLRKLSRKKIEVGILTESHMAMVGTVNEFGIRIKVTKKMRNYLGMLGLHLRKETKEIVIPERSFIRSVFDSKRTKNRLRKLAEKVFDTDAPPEKLLDAIGLMMVSTIQKKIRSNIKPENHPFTTKMKGGKNKTLVNNGHLVRAIEYKVV